MPDITNFDCCQNGNRIEVEAAAITRQAGRQADETRLMRICR